MDFMNLHQSAHSNCPPVGRLIPDATAPRPQDGRPATGRTRRSRAPGLVDKGRGRLGASRRQLPDRAVRRQHARGRGHGRRQGRGAGPARLLGQRLPASPTSFERVAAVPRNRGGHPASTRMRPTTRWRGAAIGRRPPRGLRTAARIEGGLRSFLGDGGFGAFTDTFEDLGALARAARHRRPAADGRRLQLRRRGRLEGRRAGPDPQGGRQRAGRRHLVPWRTTVAAWANRSPRCSAPTCSRSARRSPGGKASCEIHPLSIGDHADPVRLVLNRSTSWDAVVVGLTDLGDRFRLIASEVDIVKPDAPLPRLPVARAVWRPRPNLPPPPRPGSRPGGPHAPRRTERQRWTER